MKKDFTFWPAMRGRHIGRPSIWRTFCCAAMWLCATALRATPVDYTITTTGNAITITDNKGNGETLTVSESGGNIRFVAPVTRTYIINGITFANFSTPADVPLAGVTSITINTAGGNDNIDIGAFSANLPTLTVNGGTGNDAVNFNGGITFAPNANLDLNLQNDDANPGADRVTLNGANLILSGSGMATIKVSRDIPIIGSSIATENGHLILEANQQTTPTSGLFDGIGVSAGEIKVTGTGTLTATGRGGDASVGSGRGIHVSSGGKITGGSGMVTVNGTGGASVGNNNIGVLVITSSITSSGGAVSVTGQGGGSGTSGGNVGVAVSSAGQITAGGSGTVTVNGTGGAGTGNNNHGVSVRDANSRITSSSGAVSVTGTGTNGANDILMASGGAVTSTSTTAGITLNSTTNGTFPNTAGTDISTDATQKTTFGTGSTLNIDIDGTTVNTQYQQLGVVGQIDLNNAALTFAGSTWSPVANTFTIVNNDGSDAIISTFNGLSQGAIIPNFLGSALNAQISYTGGDGNDVVLAVAPPVCVAPAITTPVSSNSPICAGGTLNLSMGVSGTEPLSYTWGGTGTFANGSTATPTVTGAATGTYTVTVTNGCGSTTGMVPVTVNPVPILNVLATPINASVCAGQNVTLNATGNNDLTFDGVNDYVNAGNITQMNGATQLTVEGMFYLTRRAIFTTLFAKRLNDNNLFQVQYEGNIASGNRLIFAVSNNSAKAVGICPENSFLLNTWHHLAAVYDASGATKADQMKIYIDGVLVPLTFSGPRNVAGVPIGGPVPSSTANITSPLLLGTETLRNC